MTGEFIEMATFGAGEANQTILTSAGSRDLFVAKYGSDGALLWAKRAGGSSVDVGRGIATDRRGNSYVTGDFFGTATFGAGEANQTILTSAGSSDLFVAKYGSDGALLWATSAGGPRFVFGSSIATDRRGNSYVTGGFAGTATFGAGEANETSLTSAATGPFAPAGSSIDFFVAKYAPDGALLWAKRAGGAQLDAGRGIATAPRGNTFVTGDFAGEVAFGAGETNETIITSAGVNDIDIFVAKYRRGLSRGGHDNGGDDDDNDDDDDNGDLMIKLPNAQLRGRNYK